MDGIRLDSDRKIRQYFDFIFGRRWWCDVNDTGWVVEITRIHAHMQFPSRWLVFAFLFACFPFSATAQMKLKKRNKMKQSLNWWHFFIVYCTSFPEGTLSLFRSMFVHYIALTMVTVAIFFSWSFPISLSHHVDTPANYICTYITSEWSLTSDENSFEFCFGS